MIVNSVKSVSFDSAIRPRPRKYNPEVDYDPIFFRAKSISSDEFAKTTKSTTFWSTESQTDDDIVIY